MMRPVLLLCCLVFIYANSDYEKQEFIPPMSQRKKFTLSLFSNAEIFTENPGKNGGIAGWKWPLGPFIKNRITLWSTLPCERGT